ncbi:MAG: hypothetical protein DSY81_01355 [Bacillota bacterium]|nr:MAG: hypothetical protein DSY81_01355 [Bacillota bacterium]
MICISLLSIWMGCDGTQPPPADCCLISENGGEGLRRVEFSSGEEIFLEAASFDTSALMGMPVRVTPGDPASPLRLIFRDRVLFDSFITTNQGRSMAVVLTHHTVVIRCEITLDLSEQLQFAREWLTDLEKDALGGWGWGPSRSSPVEYCLVQETATDSTRAVHDLNGATVHIEPACFTAKTQSGAGSSGTGVRALHSLRFQSFADPDISSMPQFLARYEGRKLAVVHEDVAAVLIPIHRHIPGQFLLEGVSKADDQLWKQEWRNWR